MADNIIIKMKTSKAVGAMLGAAFDDALGWPNERVGKSKATNLTASRPMGTRGHSLAL
ncbi:hypothetical protein DSCO28_24090 [Desulfosarcina ovata subsp. sediminis]|uniref:Uncharacterized protein n=1 Tax=Desulfosarcina ovata subsp. sediminis TaxID=885957 RepID=A0A5K7ZRJ5_9BACT|nr:hypothetical protein DSCO28_24090 [Desulfosarcina ovata subsp. sediminis]